MSGDWLNRSGINSVGGRDRGAGRSLHCLIITHHLEYLTVVVSAVPRIGVESTHGV